MKQYEITYCEAFVDREGLITGTDKRIFWCHATSKLKALMTLVNMMPVHEVISVKRVKG